jgi:hypothetical protein
VLFRGDPHREQAILERVVREDIGERGTDHRPDPKPRERPRSMFAGRAASEIVPGQENPGFPVVALVEYEIRPRSPVVRVPPVGEEIFGKTALVRHLQESRRDDLVRVNIVHEERNDTGRECRHFLHQWSSSCCAIVRGSVSVPVTALAAAVSGEARNVLPPFPCLPSKFLLLVLTAYCPGPI